MTVLHAEVPHDPASIFALVLLVAVGAMLYIASRPKKTGDEDKPVPH